MNKEEKRPFLYKMLVGPFLMLGRIIIWMFVLLGKMFQGLIFGVTFVYYRFVKRPDDSYCASGEEYERICCKWLRRHGFRHIETTPHTADHGIDIIAKKRKLRYAIQCKFYSSPIGNAAVQQAYSGCEFYECDVPVVLTNQTFTRNAYLEAEELQVELWEGNKIPY